MDFIGYVIPQMTRWNKYRNSEEVEIFLFHKYFRNFKVQILKLDVPSLEVSKVMLDRALSNLI